MTEPEQAVPDGIHALPPRDQMCPIARKLRATYDITPDAPLVHREFGFFCLERWYEQGLDRQADLAEVFGYDPFGMVALGGAGWCEAAFSPCFEEVVVEDRGDHEVIQDFAGRHVLYFKGRRSGFMPEYLTHPVTDMKSWEEHVKWRLDPSTPSRYEGLEANIQAMMPAIAEGIMVRQSVVGGYMYLRSLMGPADLLYKFIDEPELIHDCMRQWLAVADAIIARHQQHVTIDELAFGEDICYNHGSLISPDMVREFLFPYYQQLITNLRQRQIDKTRKLFIHIDTDGDCVPVIPLYREIGMNAMSPFEVASGCDVVQIGRNEPDLMMLGGIDKRVLATTPAQIDAMLDRIIPAMRRRGGYIPTCDHGVPEEVSLNNYLHYRKRMRELGG